MSARDGPSAGRLGRCLLGCALLVSLRWAVAEPDSRYGSGRWRRGRRLTGASPLLRRRVTSTAQCLALCGRSELCTSLQFGDLSPEANCELFEERVCDGHELVDDPSVSYYDVYRQPAAEAAEVDLWQHERCTRDGYCSPSCIDELCAAGTCSSQPPPNAYHCVAGLCQLTDDFWEVEPGLVLPKWINWMASPFITVFKKLKPDTCALNISLKLVGGEVDFGIAAADAPPKETELIFKISNSSVDLIFRDENATRRALVQAADTSMMVTPNIFSQLRLSWCGGVMSIGPPDNPTLVTAFANVTQELPLVYIRARDGYAMLKVEEGVADPWLFGGGHARTDPVFKMVSRMMISRSITPTQTVSVTYDCMAEKLCGVFFGFSPVEVVHVAVGASYDRIALHYDKLGQDKQVFHRVTIGPLLSTTTFTTFTVLYAGGTVTVYKAPDMSTAIYTATIPVSLPDVTSVGIGSNYGTRGIPLSVRAAQYDPAWRVDTWANYGTGFSNMALDEVPLV